jgi:hypothetical protein
MKSIKEDMFSLWEKVAKSYYLLLILLIVASAVLKSVLLP